MNENENEWEGIRPPKGCLWCAGAVIVLVFLFAAFPSYIWDGTVWITVYVEVTDAATGKPVSDTAVTLQTELRTKFPDAPIRNPTVLSAQTDAHGRAALKEMFFAGGDGSGTGVNVGTSSVHCVAAGYVPADIRVSSTGRLRFRKFLFYEQAHSTTLHVALKHQ